MANQNLLSNETATGDTSHQIFNFDNSPVRTINRDGEIWFVAADVCAAIELANPRQVVSLLDKDEKGVCTISTLGGPQETMTINESGLYSLILTSRKEEAKRFKRWITHEVLPSIRKTGSYTQSPIPPSIDGQRLLVTFLPNGEVESKALRHDVCVVSPSNLSNMLTLVREFVPNDILVEMMRYAFERLSSAAHR